MGGTTTYGYTLQKSGKANKRGHDLMELVIDDYQADIVRTIFDLFINKGYGPQRITTRLTEMGVMSRSGKPFHPGSIRGILRNGTYDGYLKFGKKRSQRLPNIVILEDGVFQQAQEIIAQRSKKHLEKEEKRSAPINTTGHGLLSGNVFCGHCGSRLSMATSVKKLANGEKYRRYRYSCYGKLRRQTNCCGQTGYTMHIVDDIIREVVRNIFIQFGSTTRDELVGTGVSQKVRAWKAE